MHHVLSRPNVLPWYAHAYAAGHAGIELQKLVAEGVPLTSRPHSRAAVLSCGTGSDAIFLLKYFRTVACIELCAQAIAHAHTKLQVSAHCARQQAAGHMRAMLSRRRRIAHAHFHIVNIGHIPC